MNAKRAKAIRKAVREAREGLGNVPTSYIRDRKGARHIPPNCDRGAYLELKRIFS